MNITLAVIQTAISVAVTIAAYRIGKEIGFEEGRAHELEKMSTCLEWINKKLAELKEVVK